MKNNIAELRRAAQITQEDLANAVGVSRQTIISLEGGRYTASLPLAFKLANYFGQPIENIFVYEEEEK
ncbi:MAG: helix-turn-helix transcriptional regulator [Oscillospiraceae bacterium]|nr:helix-turn-helix transcriptional regulator [Oscillospiraceae bacterium]